MRRSLILVATFVAGLFIAMQLAAFMEGDACMDAGGRFHSDTGYCEVAAGESYIALFARPRLYVLWTFVLGAAALPTAALFLGQRLMRLASKSPE
jgi:hypothetical protein